MQCLSDGRMGPVTAPGGVRCSEQAERQREGVAVGVKVNASQAAALVDRTERRVREWIKQGKLRAEPAGPRKREPGKVGPSAWAIDVDELAMVPGVTINRERLAELEAGQKRSPSGVLARLDRLEADVQMLRTRLRTLETLQTTTTTAMAPQRAQDGPGSPVDPVGVESYVPPAFSLTYRAPAAPATFRTHTDASRWLDRHGVPINTSKGWPSWRQVQLEPRAVLQDALSRYDPANWRISWRLHQCDDVLCVCRELLG
jgi:hypothetical protein